MVLVQTGQLAKIIILNIAVTVAKVTILINITIVRKIYAHVLMELNQLALCVPSMVMFGVLLVFLDLN